MAFWYADNSFRYHLIPPVFLIFFTGVVQYMAIIGQGKPFTWDLALECSLGNRFSWYTAIVSFIWAVVWLKVPGPTILGPVTPFGYRPLYKNNGFSYYIISSATFLLIQSVYPIGPAVYKNMPQILGSLSISALILCTWLLIKGKVQPEHDNDKLEPTPLLYEFYRGVELHPRVFGVDVKQFTNCRVGMLGWQIYIYCYYFASVERNGFNPGALTCLLLQTIYIGKFFWWESGYFFTLDMMLDRAGYYLCWGCLVWIPCLFTYTSYYIVAHPPLLSTATSILLFVFGVVMIFLIYRVDYEKETFRSAPNYKCQLWGKPAKYVLAEYTDVNGKHRKTALLTSGFWGIARHTNYVFDFSSTFSWSACGWGHGVWPFLCVYFLGVLFVHRTYRDDDKCSKKYGKYWQQYCKEVPYRLIPGIW